MKRRTFLTRSLTTAGALTGAGALLDACGSGGSNPVSSGPVNLNIMIDGIDTTIGAAQISAFEKAHNCKLLVAKFDQVRLNASIAASIPIEMEEAAILDGCGYWRIFWQIFLPLSFPAIATVVILSFTSVWGDFFAPAIFLSNDKMTLAVAISNGYVDQTQNVLTNVQAAGTIFYILPVLVLVFFAQRYFVRGIVTSGLKG